MTIEPDHEYHGWMARSWDDLRGDTSDWPDRHAYLELIDENGQPVLDVGCGTGRLLLDYAALGIDVDGVDNSPDMLAICRERAVAAGLEVRLHEQTMQDLDLPRRYRTILVPSSSFQLLVEPEDAAATLRRFLHHLLPGGLLVLPFMRLWSGDGAPPTAPPTTWDVVEAERADGTTIRRSSRAWYELDGRLEHTEDVYELVVNGAVVESRRHRRSPATRGYGVDEALRLVRSAGFTDVLATAGWHGTPATPDDHLVVVTARRPRQARPPTSPSR